MSAEAPIDYGLVRELQSRVAQRLLQDHREQERLGAPARGPDSQRQLGLSLISAEVSAYITRELQQGRAVPGTRDAAALTAAIDAAIFGAGELQALLDDPLVENVDINGCDGVWVTYADHRGTVRENPIAESDEALIDMVRSLGSYAGMNARPFTAAAPELDLRLGDGSRLSAIMTASPRPLVSIRRNRFPQMFISEVPAHARRGPGAGPGSEHAPSTLLDLGTVDERLAAFLTAAVLARCNIIVAGATDAGKTTLLRALINAIPPQERLITVERALELGLSRHPHLHPNVAELEEVLPAADGSGGVSIGQLVRRTRRQNPDRVIVGEVLGPEVVEMLSAMSQGNDGSLSTIHARSAVDVFDRLAVYAAQHEGLAPEVTHGLVGQSIDYVVFVHKNPLLGGRRTVSEVVEVTGSNGAHVTRAKIFTPSRIDGRAQRDQEVSITRGPALATAGYDDVHWSQPWATAPAPQHQFDPTPQHPAPATATGPTPPYPNQSYPNQSDPASPSYVGAPYVGAMGHPFPPSPGLDAADPPAVPRSGRH